MSDLPEWPASAGAGGVVIGSGVTGATPSALLATDGAGHLISGPLSSSVAQGSPPSPSWMVIEWTQTSAFFLTSATRNGNEVITSASVTWPDGATGTFTATTISSAFNTIDAFTVTYVYGAGPTTHTVTQAAVTRDTNGAVTAQPTPTFV